MCKPANTKFMDMKKTDSILGLVKNTSIADITFEQSRKAYSVDEAKEQFLNNTTPIFNYETK